MRDSPITSNDSLSDATPGTLTKYEASSSEKSLSLVFILDVGFLREKGQIVAVEMQGDNVEQV